MKVEVVMPKMGESIMEGTVVRWVKKVGDKVKKDETLLEISTDKVDSDIPSPASGILTKILIEEQQTVPVQTVIAEIEMEAGAVVETQVAPAKPPETKTAVKEEGSRSSITTTPPKVSPSLTPSRKAEEVQTEKFYSPLVLNIARAEGISLSELETIPGTGASGRVTKKDILDYVAARKAGTPRVAAPPQQLKVGEMISAQPTDGHEIIKMDIMRKSIAERMVRSIHTSAHVAAVSEADVSKIVNFVKTQAGPFEKREGFKLTYTPFIVHAAVKALKDYTLVNSSIDGDKVIVKKYINVGIAVSLESGLIVPVIKRADEKNLVGLARAVYDLGTRARTKKLLPEEVQNGTFTITNYGVFGNLIGTPIINQPQLAILGVGAIQKRPVVIEDAIAIRSMIYLTLSFDHRLIDGALGGQFLERIVYYLENFDTNISL